MKLDKSLAFQVVNTIKDTCGQDINFIDKQGMIFASTNADRIGTFHAIGHKAAQTEQTIEVFSDDDFPGTQKGDQYATLLSRQFSCSDRNYRRTGPGPPVRPSCRPDYPSADP